MTAQIMSHPPRRSFHLAAYGSSQPKILSLKTRNKTVTTTATVTALPSRAFCTALNLLTVLNTCRWSFSALSMMLSRKLPPLRDRKALV